VRAACHAIDAQALANMGNEEAAVRALAYNLLAALAVTFGLAECGRLLTTAHLALPMNNTAFVTAISASIAGTEPHLTLEFVEQCVTVSRARDSP